MKTLLIAVAARGIACGGAMAGDDCHVGHGAWQPREAVMQAATGLGCMLRRSRRTTAAGRSRARCPGRRIKAKLDPATLQVVKLGHRDGQQIRERDRGNAPTVAPSAPPQSAVPERHPARGAGELTYQAEESRVMKSILAALALTSGLGGAQPCHGPAGYIHHHPERTVAMVPISSSTSPMRRGRMPEPCGWPAASRSITNISATGIAPPVAATWRRLTASPAPVSARAGHSNHPRPCRCAVRCGLYAACRRRRGGHARQPERHRRAADDGRSGKACARPQVCRQPPLRHVATP